MAPSGPPIEETPAVRTLAGALPAVFWVVYSLSNVVLPGSETVAGPVTLTKIIYLAMIPAAIFVAVRWRRYGWPGRGPYLMFVAWALLTCSWGAHTIAADVPKRLLIYGLLGLCAAQMLIGQAVARRAFAVAVCLAAAGLSIWTIVYALASGFAYRAGVPINPNLPATLIGPGLLTSMAVYVRSDIARGRWVVLSVALVSTYACLLLGSRGVLLALVASIAVLLWRLRPSFARVRGLAFGGVAVVALAQMPVVPYTIWTSARTLTSRVQGPGKPDAASTGVANSAKAAESTRRVLESPGVLDPGASRSTAIARFGEEEAGSFNLRRDLWLGALRYLGSKPLALLVGGGMGMSQAVAHDANPVFSNIHNSVLQIWTDFGLVGLALFGCFHWLIVRRLWRAEGWYAAAALSGVIFWLGVGLTATVTDMHVYWVALAAAATGAAAQGPIPSAARASGGGEP